MTHRFLFAGILVVGAALRLWGLGSESLWHDEAWTWYLVHDSLGDLLHRLIRSDAHPPLYFLLLWPWVKLGDSETLLRLPSALLGIASLPLLYRLGRSLAGAREGLVAMALLAVSPFHVMYSQEARSYSLLFFLCLLSLNLLVAVRRRPGDRHRWAALAAVTAAIVYTESLGVFFIIGEIVIAAARGRVWGRGASPPSFRAFPPFPKTFRKPTTGHGVAIPKPVPAVLGWNSAGYRLSARDHGGDGDSGSPALAILVLAAALPAIGVVVLGLGAPRLTRRPELAAWVWATILPVLSMGAAGFFISIFCARGLIYVLAPLLALAAVGATSIPGLPGRLAIAGTCRALHARLHPRRVPQEDWRAAARFLRDNVGNLGSSTRFLDVNSLLLATAVRSSPAGQGPSARGKGTRSFLVWVARRAYPQRLILPGSWPGRSWSGSGTSGDLAGQGRIAGPPGLKSRAAVAVAGRRPSTSAGESERRA